LREYETKKVEKKVLSKVTCDVCKKEIKKGEEYYNVTTHHNDWGNDSVDSFKDFDICSDDCLKVKFVEFVKAQEETKHIDIAKEKAEE
jgi:hypothetical protein